MLVHNVVKYLTEDYPEIEVKLIDSNFPNIYYILASKKEKLDNGKSSLRGFTYLYYYKSYFFDTVQGKCILSLGNIPIFLQSDTYICSYQYGKIKRPYNEKNIPGFMNYNSILQYIIIIMGNTINKITLSDMLRTTHTLPWILDLNEDKNLLKVPDQDIIILNGYYIFDLKTWSPLRMMRRQASPLLYSGSLQIQMIYGILICFIGDNITLYNTTSNTVSDEIQGTLLDMGENSITVKYDDIISFYVIEQNNIPDIENRQCLVCYNNIEDKNILVFLWTYPILYFLY